ncbi:MAG: MarR family winged helix-turn-helix transcriptional regulator [Solirubrobacterales bacterium]
MTETTTTTSSGGFSWLAEETGRTDPASQAWSLMHWLMIASKARFMAINQEFDLAPQQAIALRILGGGARPMGELAKFLACDSSNVTGITDRLEERGLVRRTSAEHDRRVKLLLLTDEGERVRAKLTKLLAEPPDWIKDLPEKDQRQLRDILEKAVEGQQLAESPAA